MGIDIFQNFYRGKRVLITGHTGFKGSWLAIWLHKMGGSDWTCFRPIFGKR